MAEPQVTVAEAVEGHQAWLQRRRSPGTVAKYGQHLQPLVEWAGDRPLAELSARELESDFLGPWSQTVSPATVRNRIAALRSLFSYAERYEIVDRNPMRVVDAPQVKAKPGNWLQPEQDRAVLDAAYTPQEVVVVNLLRFTGLRVSEACQLRWSDVDLGQRSLIVRTSKTDDGVRQIPIHPELLPLLRRWRELHPAAVYVLGANGGSTPNHPQFLWRIVRRVGEAAGVEGLHPHSLRRTFGSELINRGLRLEAVSKLLGHSSTVVTEQAYAFLLNGTIASEVQRVWNA